MFSQEDLTPICLAIIEEAKQTLPKDISRRLKHNRAVRRHGSYNDVLVFQIWDEFQIHVFDRQHFAYCLNYHPNRPSPAGFQWVLHLWLNRQRIYHHREEILKFWEHALRAACPNGFTFTPSFGEDWSIETKFEFNICRMCELQPLIAPRLTELIRSTHGALAFIYDTFDQPLTPEERKQVIQGKKKFNPSHRRFRTEELSLFGRFIRASDKQQVLKWYENQCGFCGRTIVDGDVEFHHVLAYRDGGLRNPENFVPLHLNCHDEVHRIMDCGAKPKLRKPKR